MSHLRIDGVWQEYGDSVVLERVNLELEGPEFCAVVGASGCGKSTLLRMLLGQEAPSRGRITLDGEALRAVPGPDRGIVYQRYSVFPHLTVLENVMLGLELEVAPVLARTFGSVRTAIRERCEKSLEDVGLSAARDRHPSQLSGGMQQRLAIAQSLVKEPKLLLLDEPFGALDPGIRGEMQTLVRELWERARMTVFMVTHDIQEGFQLGTRLIVLDRVRNDPHAPERYGATITYDLPLESR